jgi:hypothetical protein
MVSQWMPNDNMVKYLAKHPEVNRLDLVGLLYRQSDSALTGP